MSMLESYTRQSALIGHTGFVGSNLAEQFAFRYLFNSKNISEIKNRRFDLVVCAGISAMKWIANKKPAEDWSQIRVLLENLESVTADRFVLISTIDVYPKPIEVDEDFDPAQVENHAYGRHRLMVEQFIASRFPLHHIVRLPGLFGKGLKKNLIFDLLNNNCLDLINSESTFQYYDLSKLWHDIQKVMKLDIRLINLSTGPLAVKTILDRFFSGVAVGGNPGPAAHYNFLSKYAAAWNGNNGYLYSADQTLQNLAAFIVGNRR